ncbi:putative threonylcarbamoyl-AMP synthase [Esox lucius]|uniref:putative threonylcarbamoyl-AMP synthase n=1 Tax=Esox lucius TaxID=8010 RepID=UPI0014769DC5|nr:putative threonylcarbamoyl-AMP synthase [Esox lucius]
MGTFGTCHAICVLHHLPLWGPGFPGQLYLLWETAASGASSDQGVGPAYERVGTVDSIMIRVPDHTVTGHLCDITGPLAITSTNPSGEPDSTHHDMIISRLGHKIQGVLCDGESNELVGSTVVNCLKIDEGTIGIVREGCVPALKVQQIFERVKSNML